MSKQEMNGVDTTQNSCVHDPGRAKINFRFTYCLFAMKSQEKT